jgi:hypothetical protein
MTHSGDVGTEFAPEFADDPDLAARLDDLLHRTCSLARALTGAEQAAFSVDLDGDGHAARKFFNLSTRYERWRDYRVDPQGSGHTASNSIRARWCASRRRKSKRTRPGPASAIRPPTIRRCAAGLRRRFTAKTGAAGWITVDRDACPRLSGRLPGRVVRRRQRTERLRPPDRDEP